MADGPNGIGPRLGPTDNELHSMLGTDANMTFQHTDNSRKAVTCAYVYVDSYTLFIEFWRLLLQCLS